MKMLLTVYYIFITVGVFAQDLIIFKDGNTIEAKVMEISPTEIRYKRFNHLDGPTIVIPTENVLSIRYENGITDIINAITQPLAETPPLAETSIIIETPTETTDTTDPPVPTTVSITDIQPETAPDRNPLLNTLGISLGYLDISNFGFSVFGTVSPGPYTFFDFNLALGFWDFSFNGNVNFNGFVPFNRGGWYGGLGLGGGVYEKDGSYNGFFSINAATGFIFFDWLNISATLQMEMFPEFNLRFKPMLGYIYRFNPPDEPAQSITETVQPTVEPAPPISDQSQFQVNVLHIKSTQTALSQRISQDDTVQSDQHKQPAALPENFVSINEGTFLMGKPPSENNTSGGSQHQVTISSFYMSKYEVTQKEYQEVMGANPSRFMGENRPVEMVSWFDAIEYCNKRSIKEGLRPAYIIINSEKNITVTWNCNANGYRLPTETEWEYACRAGTITSYNTGSQLTKNQANFKHSKLKQTADVGSYDPNPWGLYDMYGNVSEWCWDWYGNYTNAAEIDPTGAVTGSGRVLRGGSWDSLNNSSTYRTKRNLMYRNDQTGFRVVISPLPVTEYSALLPDNDNQHSIIDHQQVYDNNEHFWSFGISFGTSFAAPLLAGSLSVTLSPYRNSFLEMGVDFGILSSNINIFYTSVSPFIHYSFTKPLANLGRWYIGAGGSYNDISINETSVNIFALDIKAGFFFNFGIEVSYTLRTDFSSASNTLLIGYRHRFIKE